ncbi:MAG TPA: glycosyltransferase, partial [Dehalococcoidia bacterium]
MLANFDSPHAWRWTKVFVARGHEVHAISYYPPARELPGAYLHVLRPVRDASGSAGTTTSSAATTRLPPSVLRLLNAYRFSRAGLSRLVHEIRPDVLQAHFVVEHGLFGALTGYHPFAVNAWGSDLFQAPRSPAGRLTARFVLKYADLVNANDPALARAAITLGAAPAKVTTIGLGLDREWLDAPASSVNLRPDSGPPTVISDRALEPLYNIDVVIKAFARISPGLPGARLLIAGAGSQA